MNRGGKITFCLIGGLVLTAGVRADDTVAMGDPYATVVERNIFGLKPLRPPDANPQDANPPPKIMPDGIMSILGELQVLFKVAPPPKPGGPPPPDETYILSEGQRQDDIEVVKIDEKNGIVTFNNHGETQTLPLVTTLPASASPGGPEIPAVGRPAGLGGRFNPGLANPGGESLNGNLGAGNRGNGTGDGKVGYNPNVPSLGSNSRVPIAQPGYHLDGPPVDPAVQTVAIEALRQQFINEGDSSAAKILPPTDLTPGEDSGQ